jgi:multiple sugar transport system substrate-binding protein
MAGGDRVARRINRRDFLKVGGVGFAGVALLGAAGCGGGGGGGEGGVQRFTFTFGPDPSGSLQDLVERFNEEYRGRYEAVYREMPADTGQYFNKIRNEFQAGADSTDLVGGDVVWPVQFAENDFIEPLTERFPPEEQEAFLPAPIEANTYDGEIWGVPWFTDAGMLYYRRDLLEEAGFSEPPKTWEELKEQARKTTRDTDTRYGFVFQGANYEGGVVNGLEYIWTHGGDVVDADDANRIVIASPESVAGLTTERSMIEDGIAPQAVTTFTEFESHSAFLRGESVFIRNWPYMYGLLADPEQSRVEPEQVSIAPLPVGGRQDRSFSGLGGWSFYLNAASDVQDAAYAFAEFATSPEQQKIRALDGGFLPTLEELYEDEEILDKVPVARLGREAIRNARPRPLSPYYSDMALRMGEQFSASLEGEIPPEEAVDRLQEGLQEIVDLGER